MSGKRLSAFEVRLQESISNEIRSSAGQIDQLTRKLEGDYNLTSEMQEISEQIRAHALWILSKMN